MTRRLPSAASIALSAVALAARLALAAAVMPAPEATSPRAEVAAVPPAVSRGRILDISGNPDFAKLAATMVTLDLDPASRADPMTALYTALAIPVPPNKYATGFHNGIPPITLHQHQVPLLQALLQFSAQSNARLRTLTPQILEFWPSTEIDPKPIPDESTLGVWCVAGPFAISLDRIKTSVVLPPGGEPTRSAIVTITAYAEPTLKVVQYPHELHVDGFVDELDHILTILPPQPRVPITRMNSTPSTMRYTLQMPAHHGHTIALLRGTAPFNVLTESVALETPVPLTESQTASAKGMTVLVAPDTSPPYIDGIPQIRVRISRGDMPRDRWQAIAPVLAGMPVQAYRNAAPTLPPNVRGIDGGYSAVAVPIPPAESVELVLDFARSNTAYPAANRAILNIPAAVREVAVPFEFKDIILP
jgi:hypothetical protein